MPACAGMTGRGGRHPKLTALTLMLLLFPVAAAAAGHRFHHGIDPQSSDSSIVEAVSGLAREAIPVAEADGADVPPANLAHLQLAAGRYADAAGTIRSLMSLETEGDPGRGERWTPHLMHAQARAAVSGGDAGFEAAYAEAFRRHFAGLDDLAAHRAQYWFVADAERFRAGLLDTGRAHAGTGAIVLEDVFELARLSALSDVYSSAMPLSTDLIAQDEQARYAIEDDLLIRTEQGATLSALVARPRGASGPQPSALLFTIYTDPGQHRSSALQAAARGYVGVVVDARGKRLSGDRIVPYEHEADDAHATIDWIARQPWSNGQVGMIGGSYSGFAAWAAAKRMHPALKTIVPYSAAIPGQGLPMENNVFVSANYAWPFFVANNRFLDEETYFQRERWSALYRDWYASGRPYREIDRVDGTPNPWLQRWLRHPAYDGYWQAMVPYGDDYARIDIPVLSITGYYDDGQISALHYLKEHYRHRPDAEHYLLIGPYDHLGAQAPFKPRLLRGYETDPVAQFDTTEVAFQWLDHVLRGGPKPGLLKDRINHQLMGANEWRHAPSLDAAGGEVAIFHLSGARADGHYLLSVQAPAEASHLAQTVDFADRTTMSHSYYPDPVVRDAFEPESGLSFVSEPFESPVSISGTFSGELRARINKRDLDFTVVLYELMPDGRAMQLSYYLGRASHARDMGVRELLAPGEWTMLPFERTRMTSRRLEAGSRLLVVLDVVKDAWHQVNHGTGGDVSDESIADADVPLEVQWRTDSRIHVPLRIEPANDER